MEDTRQKTGFMLSLALHAAMAAVAVFGIGGRLKVDMDKPMYSVDLVSLNPSEDPAAGEKGEPAPGPSMAPDEAQQQAAAIPAEQAKPKPEPKPKDDAKAISEKKIEDKKKLEAEKKAREDLLKDALKDVKKDVTDKSKVKDALKDVRDQAVKDAKKDAISGELAALRKSEGGNIFTAGGTGKGGAGGGTGAGAGGTGTGLMSVYGDIVKQIIKKNWRYPAFGTETNVAVVLEINIDPTGKITAARVAQASGKPDFDDSALRAVQETEKLPPPRVKSLDTLRITFNLQELRK